MSQGQHHQETMLATEREAERVIEKATHEAITPDEAALLKWAAGISTTKEKHNGKY